MSQPQPAVEKLDESHSNLGAKLAAGGVSCMIVSAALNPMDVTKIALQTQSQLTKGDGLHGHSSARFTGFRHAALTILREEGYGRGLMKGITASMLREASYSSMRLGLYDFFKGIFAPGVKRKEDFTLLQKILAGGASGAVGSAIANPTDLVKIRFQSYGAANPNPYRNTFHAFASIYRKEGGLSALYRGVTPTTARAAVLTASQLSSYDHSKRYMLKSPYFGDTFVTHLIASLISGLVTTTATNPVDIIKTRIMTDSCRHSGGKLYSGPIDCLVKTVRHEGPLALFKGWVPNYMRLGPHFVLSLPLLEALRTAFGADTV